MCSVNFVVDITIAVDDVIWCACVYVCVYVCVCVCVCMEGYKCCVYATLGVFNLPTP